jgi:membrane protein
MLAFLRVPLSWREILKRTLKEAFWEDNCLAMSAQLAYYFFFALFPALLFVVAVASYFPLASLVDEMVGRMAGLVPPEVLTIITDQIRKISGDREGGLLTFGMLLAIWSSSGAMTAIIDTVNRAYDIEEGRPWWKVRLTAVALTVGVSVFILASFALVTVGPTFAERLADNLGLGPAFEWSWKILQWPVVFGLVSLAIAGIYYWGPDAEQDWVWLTPGAVTATLLWLLASLGFKYYVANLGSYTETYGAIGGFMVLMLWFYLSGFAILFGAEMNAEIEHASPYGKAEGEKVPGEKRKLGPARMRAWVAKRLHRGGRPPTADEVDAVMRGKAPMPEAAPDDDAGQPRQRELALPPAPRRVGNWPPAAVLRRQAHDPRTRRGPRASELILGAGVLAAQMFFAVRRSKKRAA